MTAQRDLMKFIEDAIESRRGDDLYRARASFKHCTPKEMQEQYGFSGKTRQQIIDEYEVFEKKCDEARQLLRDFEGLVKV